MSLVDRVLSGDTLRDERDRLLLIGHGGLSLVNVSPAGETAAKPVRVALEVWLSGPAPEGLLSSITRATRGEGRD